MIHLNTLLPHILGLKGKLLHMYTLTVYNGVAQGRNHGIDIGGVQMWALPQIFLFKFSRGSDRKNKQARPSTNE